MPANEAAPPFVPSREQLGVLAEAWRQSRHPRHAQLYSHVAKQLAAVEPIRELLRAGRRKQDLEAWWAVAALGDPLDFPRLAAALRGGTQEQVGNKLQALVARHDPRLATYLLDLLEDPPYAGLSSRPLLDAILQALRHVGDRGVAERTSALADRYLSIVNSSTGGWVASELRLIAQQLELPAETQLEPALADQVARLERQLKLAPEPPRTPPKAHTLAREEAFAAVYASPDSDAPRFALASLLLEQGDPRGELITLQLAQAAGGIEDATDEAAEASDERLRLAELCRPNQLAAWAAPLSNGGTCTFERGFPSKIALFRNIQPLLDQPACATLHTVVDCHKPSPPHLIAFLSQPSATSVRTIRGLPLKALQALLTSKRNWTELELQGGVGPSAEQWASLPNLTSLELSVRRLPLRAFASLSKLETLRLELDGGDYPLELPASLRNLELRVAGELPDIDWASLTELSVLKLRLEKPATALSLPPQLRRLSLKVPRLPKLAPGKQLEDAMFIVDGFTAGDLPALDTLKRLELRVRRNCAQPFPALSGLDKLATLVLSTPYETSFPTDLLRSLPALRELDAATDYLLGPEHLSGVRLERIKRLRMPLAQLEASELREAHLTLPTKLEELTSFLSRAPKLVRLKLECLFSGPIDGTLSEVQAARWRELIVALEATNLEQVTLDLYRSSLDLQRTKDGTLSRLTLHNASALHCDDLVVTSLTRLSSLQGDGLTDRTRERLLKLRKAY